MNPPSAHPAPRPVGDDGVTAETTAVRAGDGPIVFYDGVCAICNRGVQFVLRHDAAQRFRFAALQSQFARRALARHGRDPDEIETMGLLIDAGTPRERLLVKSDGIVALLRELGGGWRLLALAGLLPRALRDRAYDAFAHRRYRWFGHYDSCPLPPADARRRFIDAAEEPREERAGPMR